MIYTAFILGLVGSFHCIGMCGPIAFVIPVRKDNTVTAVSGTLLYHIGRMLGYGVIGLLFGLLGKGLYLAGFQQRLSILVGLIMILAVLIPVRILNTTMLTRPLYQMIGHVKRLMGLHLKKSSYSSLFIIGFLNGFLPCGLVYMALLGSISSGDPLLGAAYMMLFGLGTVPMMSAAIFAGNFFKSSVRNRIQKAIPIFVIAIGLLFIIRGMGLGIPYLSPADQQLLINNDPSTCITE